MVCRGTLLANGSAADTSYEWHVWCVKLRMRVPNALGGINLNASENVLDFGMMRLFSNFQLVYSQRVSHTKLKWCMISSSVRVINQTLGRSSKLFCHSSHLKVFAKGTRIICKKNLVSICKKNSKNILKHSNRSWFAFSLFQLDMFLVGAVQGTKLCKLCTCTAWLPCCWLGCYEFFVSIGKFHQKTEKISTTYGHIDLDIDCICCIMISEVRLTKMSERIALLIPSDRYQGPSAISGRKICKGLRFHSPLAAWGMLTLFDCWVIRLLPSAWNAHDWGPTRLERDGPSLSRQFLGGGGDSDPDHDGAVVL